MTDNEMVPSVDAVAAGISARGMDGARKVGALEANG
jgi:hypothetical protein